MMTAKAPDHDNDRLVMKIPDDILDILSDRIIPIYLDRLYDLPSIALFKDIFEKIETRWKKSLHSESYLAESMNELGADDEEITTEMKNEAKEQADENYQAAKAEGFLFFIHVMIAIPPESPLADFLIELIQQKKIYNINSKIPLPSQLIDRIFQAMLDHAHAINFFHMPNQDLTDHQAKKLLELINNDLVTTVSCSGKNITSEDTIQALAQVAHQKRNGDKFLMIHITECPAFEKRRDIEYKVHELRNYENNDYTAISPDEFKNFMPEDFKRHTDCLINQTDREELSVVLRKNYDDDGAFAGEQFSRFFNNLLSVPSRIRAMRVQERALVGHDVLHSILSALQFNTTLRVLEVGLPNDSELFTLLLSSLCGNSTLQKLKLAKNPNSSHEYNQDACKKILAEVNHPNSRLTELNLSLWMGDFHSQALQLLLSEHPRLRVLILDGTQLRDQTALALSRGLRKNSTLTTLSLKDNLFSHDGLTQIGSALTVNRTLTKIDLSPTTYLDKEYSALALFRFTRKIHQNRSLKKITLSEYVLIQPVKNQIKMITNRNRLIPYQNYLACVIVLMQAHRQNKIPLEYVKLILIFLEPEEGSYNQVVYSPEKRTYLKKGAEHTEHVINNLKIKHTPWKPHGFFKGSCPFPGEETQEDKSFVLKLSTCYLHQFLHNFIRFMIGTLNGIHSFDGEEKKSCNQILARLEALRKTIHAEPDESRQQVLFFILHDITNAAALLFPTPKKSMNLPFFPTVYKIECRHNSWKTFLKNNEQALQLLQNLNPQQAAKAEDRCIIA